MGAWRHEFVGKITVTTMDIVYKKDSTWARDEVIRLDDGKRKEEKKSSFAGTWRIAKGQIERSGKTSDGANRIERDVVIQIDAAGLKTMDLNRPTGAVISHRPGWATTRSLALSPVLSGSNKMADMANLCSRLEKWLTVHFTAALGSFNPGASKQQIAAHERATGFTLPDDVREWFRWRNGQKRWCKESIFFGDESLSLEESAKEWKDWQEDYIVEMNEEVAPACTSKPDSAIIAAYSLPGWIPLGQSPASANYLGIDLNPGPKGTKGQVIYFGRDVEKKCVLGASFGDFLEFLVEEMEGGRITIGVPSGTQDGDLPWTTHTLCEPGKHFDGLVNRLHDIGKFDGRRLHVDESVKRVSAK